MWQFYLFRYKKQRPLKQLITTQWCDGNKKEQTIKYRSRNVD